MHRHSIHQQNWCVVVLEGFQSFTQPTNDFLLQRRCAPRRLPAHQPHIWQLLKDESKELLTEDCPSARDNDLRQEKLQRSVVTDHCNVGEQ